MAGILEFHMNIFVPSYQSNDFDNEFDISNLIEASHSCSPVVLEYADKKQFEEELSAAIVINFCKNYTRNTVFPKKAIIALTSILQKASTESIAQRTLLLHLSKIKNDVNWATFFFCEIDSMRLRSVTSQDEIEWKHTATKVIQHEQIQNTIIESIVEFGLPIPDDMKIEHIEITLVENVTTVVRGFSGFDEIFINSNHFRTKFDSFDGDVELLQLLAKMDIISVTLHELAHVMIRKCAKNLNMSAPVLAQLKGLQPNRYEFGRYNEIRIFNKQVDWFLSHKMIDVSYIERFITSIENGHMLPTGFVKQALERVHSPGVGMDLQLPFYLC